MTTAQPQPAPPARNTDGTERVKPEAEGPHDFSRMAAAFGDAATRLPDQVVSRYYAVVRELVQLRCAGSALAEAIDAPLSHLRCEPAPGDVPALRIDLWDEAATGVSCEGCLLGPDPELTGKVTVYGSGRYVVHQSPQTRSVIDRADRRIVGWVAGHERLTQYELGRPLHSDLLLWLRDRGIQAVHSGLVALAGNGVLIGGPGGSGKTTTALTCLRAGMQYLADDYVGLERRADRAWIGHSLYCSTHLEPHHITRFPELLPHARRGRLAREDKHLVLLNRLHPEQLASRATIRVIALPRISGRTHTSVRPASKVDVLRQLAPSSLFQLPYGSAGRRSFDTIVALVEAVPTVWLELGTDLDGIPLAVAALLSRELSR